MLQKAQTTLSHIEKRGILDISKENGSARKVNFQLKIPTFRNQLKKCFGKKRKKHKFGPSKKKGEYLQNKTNKVC